jgi:hypothetical protein
LGKDEPRQELLQLLRNRLEGQLGLDGSIGTTEMAHEYDRLGTWISDSVSIVFIITVMETIEYQVINRF